MEEYKLYKVWISVSDIPCWLKFLYESEEYTQEELDYIEELDDRFIASCHQAKKRELPSTLDEWLEIFPEGVDMLPKDTLNKDKSLHKAKGLPMNKVVGAHIKLTPNGYGRWIGKCPLHKDKTASLYVYKDTNKFYCFGCHKGGDNIDFISLLKEKDLLASIDELCQMKL